MGEEEGMGRWGDGEMGEEGEGRTHNPVEFRTFVALGSPEVVFRLAGAELTKVLGGLGDDIFEELEGDSS